MPNAFIEKVNKLPEEVRRVLLSDLPAEEGYKAATGYVIDDARQNKIAKIIGLVFVKDIPLEKLPETFQKNLSLAEASATGLALTIVKSIFLPLKDYFSNAEILITTWSQKAAPPTYQPKSLGIAEETPEKTEKRTSPPEESIAPQQDIIQQDIIIERHIAAMIDEREDVVNQTVTEKPLKLADSENLKLPSIKNWLTDYKKFKTNFPDQDPALVRTKYLYESTNGKNLSGAEREVVSNLLKSLDDFIRLPFSQKTGRLMVEKLIQPEAVPQLVTPRPSPPPVTPPPRPTPPPTTPSVPPTQKDTYREQVAAEDLTGPQAPQRPEPKLDGNIVNLKDMNINE